VSSATAIVASVAEKVVVAPGEPGVPMVFCAAAGRPDMVAMAVAASSRRRMLIVALMVRSVHADAKPHSEGDENPSLCRFG
jgi:hypothetical protein